jgi:hypothetical protein
MAAVQDHRARHMPSVSQSLARVHLFPQWSLHVERFRSRGRLITDIIPFLFYYKNLHPGSKGLGQVPMEPLSLTSAVPANRLLPVGWDMLN